jgi:hypothetical protein
VLLLLLLGAEEEAENPPLLCGRWVDQPWTRAMPGGRQGPARGFVIHISFSH